MPGLGAGLSRVLLQRLRRCWLSAGLLPPGGSRGAPPRGWWLELGPWADSACVAVGDLKCPLAVSRRTLELQEARCPWKHPSLLPGRSPFRTSALCLAQAGEQVRPPRWLSFGAEGEGRKAQDPATARPLTCAPPLMPGVLLWLGI